MPRLIIITGTPGVGKSTLSRALARRVGARFIDLGEVVKTEGLHVGFDQFRGSLIIDEKRVRQHLATVLKSGGKVVVASHTVGHIAPRGVDSFAIVLRLDPILLYRRLLRKGWTKRKIWENVESELLDVCYFDAAHNLGLERAFELDTGTMSKAQVLGEALNAIRGDRAQMSRVNWLSKYDPIDLERKLAWRNISS
ncbi:hypothetical protein E6H29_00400 [Candidatus Bathyarchaeota archaeon]|nr:MAG: hypothetical protein AUJ07_05485 [Crenarchaeota archaeon 13_1_40CM_3_53_5]TMI33396.1 MAG: hypothetical protein E6H29_00400 [Candidatus Bathyarchaeota archaeon]